MATTNARTAQELSSTYFDADIGQHYTDLDKLGITGVARGEIVSKTDVATQLTALLDVVKTAQTAGHLDATRAGELTAGLNEAAKNVLNTQKTAATKLVNSANKAITTGASPEDKIGFSYTGTRDELHLEAYEDALAEHTEQYKTNLSVASEYYTGKADVGKIITQINTQADEAKLDAHNTASPLRTTKAEIEKLLSQVTADEQSPYSILGVPAKTANELNTMAPARQTEMDQQAQKSYDEIKAKLAEAHRVATKVPPHPVFQGFGPQLTASLHELDEAFAKIDTHAHRTAYTTQLEADQKYIKELSAALKSKNYYEVLGIDRPEDEKDTIARAGKLSSFGTDVSSALSTIQGELTAIARRTPSLKPEIPNLEISLTKLDEALSDAKKRETYDQSKGLPPAQSNKDFKVEMESVFKQIAETGHTAFQKLGLSNKSDAEIRNMGTTHQTQMDVDLRSKFDDLNKKLDCAMHLATLTPPDPDFDGLIGLITGARAELRDAYNSIDTHANRVTYTENLTKDTRTVKELEDKIAAGNLYDVIGVKRPESYPTRKEQKEKLATFDADVDAAITAIVATLDPIAGTAGTSTNPTLRARADALIRQLQVDPNNIKEILKDADKRKAYDESKGLISTKTAKAAAPFFETKLWKAGSPIAIGAATWFGVSKLLAATSWSHIAIKGGYYIASWVGPTALIAGIAVGGYLVYTNYLKKPKTP